MKQGDRVRVKVPRYKAEEDTGTVLNVSLGQARVRWDVAKSTYWEDPYELEVLPEDQK